VEPITKEHGEPVRVSVDTAESRIQVGAWRVRVGSCDLILLDTNVPENTDEDRSLSEHLYGGGNWDRIRQELVLGIGGMRMLTALGEEPGVVHLNEGHCAFAVLEQARMLMQREGCDLNRVRERVAGRTAFTTHTPVAAGHDRFPPDMVEAALQPMREELGLDQKGLMALGRSDPENAEEPFCMTVLGLRMARFRNGVANLHGRVSRAMWHHLWPDRSQDEVPIEHISNGVHVASYLAAPLARLYSRYLGGDWDQRLERPELWENIDRVPDEELWEQHELLRAGLVDFVRRRVTRQHHERGEPPPDPDQILEHGILTIGFARRFATYKRGALLLEDLDRLAALINNTERPVQIVFAGKAHPRDDEGKRLIQRVFEATRDPRFQGRIQFIENYDINVGRHLVQGVDLWLNVPRRPMEACGTSGQKVVYNLGLNCSILDGWWAEAYDGRNGFAIGQGVEHTDPNHQDELDRRAMFDVLEQEVVPMFYDRDADGIPHRWVARQKYALKSLAWRYCARRMLMDYTLGAYLPAVGGTTRSFGTGGVYLPPAQT
jgi:starch phosphorylase